MSNESTITKVCSYCNTNKPLEDYYQSNLNTCKACIKEKSKANYEANRKRKIEQVKSYYRKNSKIIKQKVRKYYRQNADMIKLQRKDRYFGDCKHNLYKRSTARINNILGVDIPAKDVLGCDANYLYKYLIMGLEKRNISIGLDDHINLTKFYELDHVIPLSKAKNEAEKIKLCHYTNLQLLTLVEHKNKHYNSKL